MASPEVVVSIVADTKEVNAQISAVTKEVELMGRSLSATNEVGVKAWKNSAEAGKEYLNSVNATTLQHAKFDAAVRGTQQHLDNMSHATVAGTRNMGFFSALQAEATGHVGEHSLAIGRLERNLAGFAEHALGVNSTLGLLTTSLGKFAIGGVEITAVLVGVDAIIAAYDHFTGQTREATKAQDDLIRKIEEAARLKAVGGEAGAEQLAAANAVRDATEALRLFHARANPSVKPLDVSVGSEFAPVARGAAAAKEVDTKTRRNTNGLTEEEQLNRDLKDAQDAYNAIADKGSFDKKTRYQSDLAALIEHERAMGHVRADDLAKAKLELRELQHTLRDTAATDVDGRASLTGRIESLNKAINPKEKEPSAKSLGLDEANRMANAAIRALNERMANDAKVPHELDIERQKTLEVNAQARGDITNPDAALSAQAVIEGKRELRRKEIEEMNIGAEQKAALQAQADADELAAVDDLNRKIGESNKRWTAEESKRREEVSKKHVEATRKKQAAVASAELQGVDVLLAGGKDVGRKLLAVAVEPLVKQLKALAVNDAIKSAAHFVEGDIAGGIKYAAGAALYEAGAAEVSAFAGGSGGGGGSGHSGGGGGSQAGAGLGASFGASGSATDQTIKIEIVSVLHDPTGREVSRTKQMIQRLNDRNQPTRVIL